MTAIRPYEAALLVPLWSLTAHTTYRAVHTRALPESAPSRLLAGVVSLVTLSVTVGVPAVRRVIDAVTGVQSITNVLSQLCGMSAITCLTVFVRRIATPADQDGGHRYRDWLPLLTAAAALCTAFVLTPRPSGERHLLTTVGSPALTAYWTIYTGYVIWGAAAIGVLTLRHRGHAPPGPLRIALNLIGAGAAFSLVYALHRCAYLLLRGSGIPLFDDAVVVPTTQVLLTGSLLLFSAGLAWPALTTGWRRYVGRRRLRRLEPLWRTLSDAVPEVVLPLPAQLRAEPELVLYRYAIEISDVMLALDPYRSATVEATAREQLSAHGFTGPRLAAAAEAVALRCAIARTSPEPTPTSLNTASDPQSDPLERLRLLAAHYQHPLVLSISASLSVPAED